MVLSEFREADLLFIAINRLGLNPGHINHFQAELILRNELPKLNEGEVEILVNKTVHEKRHRITKEDAPEVVDRLRIKLLYLRKQGQAQQHAQGASV